MNHQEIIDTAKNKLNAENSVKAEIKKNKAEILFKFSKKIFDFLLHIHNDPTFRFSGAAHFHNGDETKPLLSMADYAEERLNKIIEKGDVRISFSTTCFYYGSYGTSRNINIGVGDDFMPYAVLSSSSIISNDDEKFNDSEKFCNYLAEFFVKHNRIKE